MEAGAGRIAGCAAAGGDDVLPCGVHVVAIAALVLDCEERDQLADLSDVAATFGIDVADVATALSHYGRHMERLRPEAHARRRMPS